MNKKDKRIARMTALQVLYACEFSGSEPGDILAHLSENDVIKDEELRLFITDEDGNDDYSLTPNIIAYGGKIARIAISNKEFLNELIVNRSQNWEFERISVMDRLILQMAISEMLFIDEVPPKVSIAEAVEIAKVFSSSESSRFVNGILDTTYNDSQQGKIELPNK